MTGSDTEYYKSLSLKDGFNSITIKATDLNGNPTSVIREFTVDSKKPKISKTYPKKKSFASGLFEVQFKEENPVNLVLHFNGEEKILDVVADCKKIKTKTYCDIDVDLSVYDGASINYFFELIDIAGNVVRSKPLRVNVDITKPVVLNPDDFWEQGEAGSRYARYVYFDIEIDEDNFDEVSYFYEDSRGRMREKRLCSRLKEGVCEKKKSFRRGDTLLNIQVVDEAGNVEIKEIGLEINY